jgi:hypothetical protein
VYRHAGMSFEVLVLCVFIQSREYVPKAGYSPGPKLGHSAVCPLIMWLVPSTTHLSCPLRDLVTSLRFITVICQLSAILLRGASFMTFSANLLLSLQQGEGALWECLFACCACV